jgi:hypothetical protein
VVQVLAEDALLEGQRTEYVINRIGGAQGRGRVPGASPLYQICDVINDNGAPPSKDVIALAVGGLGSRAFATHIALGQAP